MQKQKGKIEGSLSGLNLSVLGKFYPLSVLATVFVSLPVWSIYNPDLAYGVLFGGLFGTVNTWLIARLAASILDPVRQNPRMAVITVMLKVPIVYGILALAFSFRWFDPMGFAIGFQLFFILLFIYVIAAHLILSQKRDGVGDDAA